MIDDLLFRHFLSYFFDFSLFKVKQRVCYVKQVSTEWNASQTRNFLVTTFHITSLELRSKLRRLGVFIAGVVMQQLYIDGALQEPVVRKVDSPIHPIVIFSTVVKMLEKQ